MYFIYILYYILFLPLIFGLVPPNALFYIRPLLIVLFSLVYSIPLILTKSLNKKLSLILFKLSLIIIGYTFFIILGEFAKVMLKVSLIMGTMASLTVLLILSGKLKLKITGAILGSLFAFLVVWQGSPIKYKSNLSDIRSQTYNIDSFTYGVNSGDVISYSVDPSSYYQGTKGLTRWYDKQFWDIDIKLPLKGTLYYPSKKGKYPLVLLLHGNHLAEDLSHNGYNYILKSLADKGYITVTIDQNFLNGNWTNLGKGNPKENDTRGLLLLEHIALINKWNKDKNSPIFNQVDMDNIGLIGHSRGGEGVSIAAAYNNKYKIKSIVTLAPTDRQYPKTIMLNNISYMTIHGVNDGDIKVFRGKYQYNRTRFNSEDYYIKISHYIEGLNHTQFNSDWGKIDSTSLGKLYYNGLSTIKDYEQREITRVLLNNYFDITLKGKKQLLPLIIDPKLNPTLPEIIYISDFQDSITNILYNFNNLDKENILFKNCTGKIGYIYDDRLLNIEWNRESSVIFRNMKPEQQTDRVVFSMASVESDPVKIDIVIRYRQNIVKEDKVVAVPKLKKKVFKLNIFSNITDEFHLQYYSIPVASKWDSMEFIPDDTSGSIVIDNLGYTTSYLKKEL